jgi:methylmalonyl-CoA mutase
VQFELFDDFPRMSGTLMLDQGEWDFSPDAKLPLDLQQTESLIRHLPPDYYGLSVDTTFLVNRGADLACELGASLALLLLYYDQLSERGLAVEELVRNTSLSMATRSAYLTDIARYRAMRRLLLRLAAAYDVEAQAGDFELRAVSATFNKPAYDQNMNILRNTTEAMAAVFGGCDTLCLLPHDVKKTNDNSFARRIARNISHLLREESRAHLVADPTAGAYAIEKLTDEITEMAWAFFLKIEKQGGFEQAWRNGLIQDAIRESAEQQQQAFDRQQKILVGANRYINRDMASRAAYPPQPLAGTNRKLAASVESFRYRMDGLVASGHVRPGVALIRLSSSDRPAFVSARIAFVEDLFASLGIATHTLDTFADNGRMSNVDLSGYQGLVCIAEDQTYAEMLPFLATEEKRPPIFLAGHPKKLALEADYQYIYKGMDVPAFAESFLEQANMNSL